MYILKQEMHRHCTDFFSHDGNKKILIQKPFIFKGIDQQDQHLGWETGEQGPMGTLWPLHCWSVTVSDCVDLLREWISFQFPFHLPNLLKIPLLASSNLESHRAWDSGKIFPALPQLPLHNPGPCDIYSVGKLKVTSYSLTEAVNTSGHTLHPHSI